MEGSLNNGMCRCCASEGTFKDVSSKYTWMGEEEIYSDMLRECFDITLANAEDEHNGICEVCITQLRNAANFKKQVQLTEEQFKKRLHDDMFKSNIIKLEVNALEEDRDGNNSDNNLSDDYSDYEVPIKTEDEPKGKKRGKAASSRAKKPKTEAESSKNKRVTRRKGQQDTEQKITLDKRTNFSTFINIKPASVTSKTTVKPPADSPPSPLIESPPKPVEKPQIFKPRKMRANKVDRSNQKRLTELDLHYDNIKTVLRYSNATPIRCKEGDRYACSYCPDLFEDPRELKAHTIDVHGDTNDKPDCLCIRSLSKYCVHLDVTDLKCELCDANMEKLEDLIDHLKVDHDELIHTNIRNLMVPYKFETAEAICVCCLKQFDDYLELQEHMSDHYKNYVCEFCDKAFLLRSTMIEHKKVVHRV